MSQVWRAAWVYFGMVYALGFLLGSLRELLIAPHFGGFWPRLIEIPVMLAASWFAAFWVVNRYGIATRADRLVMGLTAFALLMAGEALVGIGLMGRSFAQHLAGYATAQGALTIMAQSAFAVFPLLVRLLPEETDGDVRP
jgi:hypothetical protein